MSDDIYNKPAAAIFISLHFIDVQTYNKVTNFRLIQSRANFYTTTQLRKTHLRPKNHWSQQKISEQNKAMHQYKLRLQSTLDLARVWGCFVQFKSALIIYFLIIFCAQ